MESIKIKPCIFCGQIRPSIRYCTICLDFFCFNCIKKRRTVELSENWFRTVTFFVCPKNECSDNDNPKFYSEYDYRTRMALIEKALEKRNQEKKTIGEEASNEQNVKLPPVNENIFKKKSDQLNIIKKHLLLDEAKDEDLPPYQSDTEEKEDWEYVNHPKVEGDWQLIVDKPEKEEETAYLLPLPVAAVECFKNKITKTSTFTSQTYPEDSINMSRLSISKGESSKNKTTETTSILVTSPQRFDQGKVREAAKKENTPPQNNEKRVVQSTTSLTMWKYVYKESGYKKDEHSKPPALQEKVPENKSDSQVLVGTGAIPKQSPFAKKTPDKNL